MDGENNYAKVWTRIECHLLPTNIKTARIMTNWSSLLSTKCEDWDSFLSFYSKTKGILHKLTKGNSITAKGDVFLKAYFSMAISAKELRTEVKGFLQDTNATHSETLELIHADFRVQTTGDNLRDTTTRSGVTAIVQKGKTNGNISPNKIDVLARTNVHFPNNHGKLLPLDYYRQWMVHSILNI